MASMTKEHKVDTVFVLIIFCVFALAILMVLMLGASVYKNMTEITRDGQDERTLLSYIWTKVKNGDDSASVYVGDFNGLNALCFDEVFYGTRYRTVIYHYDGWVYELFSETGLDFLPEDGIRVTMIGDLSFEEFEHGLIKVSTGTRSMMVFPRGGSVSAAGNSISAGGRDPG